MTKFESDLLKTNENTALQSQVILQTFMQQGASSFSTFVKFCDFVEQ